MEDDDKQVQDLEAKVETLKRVLDGALSALKDCDELDSVTRDLLENLWVEI